MSIGALAVCVLVACTSSSTPSTDSSATPADDGGGGDAPVVTPEDAAVEDSGSTSKFGQPCTVGKDAACGEGLFCLQGPSGGKTGFCTKTCPKTSSKACPDVPAGTAAFCVVTDVNSQGDKGCAFACRDNNQTYTCPGTLKCETSEDPPGSGQYLCLP
jgi:hypothetical protein